MNKDLINRSHYEVFPEIPQRWREIHRRVLAGETVSAENDEFPRADGSVDWVRWEMTPWHNADGTVGGAVLFSELVTARRQLETKLAQAEKLGALGQLAGGIAHDFNNILQVVSAGAGLIGRRADNPATVRRLTSMVEDAAERGASVTGRLLAFARRAELRPEPVDLAELLRGLRELLAHTLGAAVSVRLDIDPGLPTVMTDRSQFETVIVNLATNARDAMPGGGTITIALVSTTVSETAPDGDQTKGLRAGPYVRLTVADTGTGMGPPTLAHIMEPFFTTKEPGKGSPALASQWHAGLRMQSGGALTVASELGQGTSVTSGCRWRARRPSSRVDKGTVTAPRGKRLRVPLVDDEDPVRQVLAEELSERGYRVVQAKGADSALTGHADKVTSSRYRRDFPFHAIDFLRKPVSGAILADHVAAVCWTSQRIDWLEVATRTRLMKWAANQRRMPNQNRNAPASPGSDMSSRQETACWNAASTSAPKQAKMTSSNVSSSARCRLTVSTAIRAACGDRIAVDAATDRRKRDRPDPVRNRQFQTASIAAGELFRLRPCLPSR